MSQPISEIVIAAMTSILASATPAQPGAIPLGDLNPPMPAAAQGAPFDPCSPAMWDGLPPDVAPERRGTSPRRIHIPDDGKGPLIMCGLDAVNVRISWGDPIGPLENPTPIDFSGRPGTLESGTDEEGRPECASRIPMPYGTAAVTAVDTGLPAINPCALVTSVSNHIARIAH